MEGNFRVRRSEARAEPELSKLRLRGVARDAYLRVIPLLCATSRPLPPGSASLKNPLSLFSLPSLCP